MFTFGIPNCFHFTFRHGPKPPSHVDESDVESKALISLPCGTLGKLPLELRRMIYTKVLYFEKCVKHPQKFLDRHPPIMVEEALHVEAIDAVLLRTCRTVYQEALGILYGKNTFDFRKPEYIENFAHLGLENTPFGYCRTASKSSSAVGDCPYGRLTMIRFLHLRFDGRRGTSWSLWCEFFYPPEKQTQLVDFPALERLSLNFTDWRLGAEDASKIRVKPFLSKLRPRGGLSHLTLVGVKHEQNVREFKHGFVKEGGTFRPALKSDITIPNTKVTHDDLPEVSMCVREIVEKDRASRARKIGRGKPK